MTFTRSCSSGFFATALCSTWTTRLSVPPICRPAAGLSLSTVLFAAGNLSALGIATELSFRGFVHVLPFAFAAVGLTIIYLALPHRRVEWRHALLGGIIAALLFEGLKSGFGIYVNRVGTFESVYGSLSALPVFLIWMYCAWAVVIFGAAIAAARPEWQAARWSAAHDGELTPARCLLRALQVIDLLHAAGRAGETADHDMLLEAAAGDGDALAAVMTQLHEAGYIARTDADRAALIRDIDDVTVHDLYLALGYAIDSFDPEVAAETPWAGELAKLLAQADTASRSALSPTIKQLLAQTGPRLVAENATDAGS